MPLKVLGWGKAFQLDFIQQFVKFRQNESSFLRKLGSPNSKLSSTSAEEHIRNLSISLTILLKSRILDGNHLTFTSSCPRRPDVFSTLNRILAQLWCEARCSTRCWREDAANRSVGRRGRFSLEATSTIHFLLMLTK